jgi:hypothetical protein
MYLVISVRFSVANPYFWLFGEQYHMLTTDKNMRVSLEKFESITLTESDSVNSLLETNEGLQRIDIFLYSQRIQEDSSSEMLIIELKAPYIKLSLDVYNQAVRYVNTIRKEPRFSGENRVWRVITVCVRIDDDVKVKYKNFEHLGRKGLVDIISNFEIYALSWDDVFQAFEARHAFLLNKLKLDYSQVTTDFGNTENLKGKRMEVDALCDKITMLSAE